MIVHRHQEGQAISAEHRVWFGVLFQPLNTKVQGSAFFLVGACVFAAFRFDHLDADGVFWGTIGDDCSCSPFSDAACARSVGVDRDRGVQIAEEVVQSENVAFCVLVGVDCPILLIVVPWFGNGDVQWFLGCSS